MSLSHDLPILVAPRPVRLTSAFAFSRSPRITPGHPTSPFKDNDVQRDLSSPSPRAPGLPSEAIEEFLSILKPSFLPSSSPTLGKSRRSLSIPAFHQYERPLAIRPWQRIENTGAITKSESDDQPSESTIIRPTTPEPVGEQQDTLVDLYDQDGGLFNRWRPYGVLSSPISRLHTRNPFLKQVSEKSPVPTPPLSPAAIPLPSPTPDELLEVI